MVRKKNNGPQCHGVEWQWEEMAETQERGREVFLHKQAREEQARKTKVKREKAATGPQGECGQGRNLCQPGPLASVALR